MQITREAVSTMVHEHPEDFGTPDIVLRMMNLEKRISDVEVALLPEQREIEKREQDGAAPQIPQNTGSDAQTVQA